MNQQGEPLDSRGVLPRDHFGHSFKKHKGKCDVSVDFASGGTTSLDHRDRT